MFEFCTINQNNRSLYHCSIYKERMQAERIGKKKWNGKESIIRKKNHKG